MIVTFTVLLSKISIKSILSRFEVVNGLLYHFQIFIIVFLKVLNLGTKLKVLYWPFKQLTQKENDFEDFYNSILNLTDLAFFLATFKGWRKTIEFLV